MSNLTIKKLIKQIKDNRNGITLNKDGTVFKGKKGFIYSITNNTIRGVTLSNIKSLLNAMSLLEKSFNNNLKIGSWFSKERKKWFVDISVYEPQKRIACYEARKYKQLAVWDIKNSLEIRLK